MINIINKGFMAKAEINEEKQMSEIPVNGYR